MFLQLLQSAEMSPFLGTQDFEDMYEYYTGFPDGKASYNEFFGLVREAILRVYRAKDPSEVGWDTEAHHLRCFISILILRYRPPGVKLAVLKLVKSGLTSTLERATKEYKLKEGMCV